MPIEFRCTGCQKLLRTQDDTAGKQAKCPSCGTLVPIPESAVLREPSAPAAARRAPPVSPTTAPVHAPAELPPGGWLAGAWTNLRKKIGL